MNNHSGEPRALFPLSDGSIYPDALICSGVLPAELGGTNSRAGERTISWYAFPESCTRC